MNFNSTNIPSQHVRPLHHKVYAFSVSLIKPLLSISILPSSPKNGIKINIQHYIIYISIYKPTKEKLSSNNDLCVLNHISASRAFFDRP